MVSNIHLNKRLLLAVCCLLILLVVGVFFVVVLVDHDDKHERNDGFLPCHRYTQHPFIKPD